MAMVCLWAIVLTLTGSARADGDTIAVVDFETVDEAWRIDEAKGTLSYSGDEAPELVIHKAALKQRGVSLEITGEMSSVRFESDQQQFTIGDSYAQQRVTVNRSLLFHNGKTDPDASSAWRTLLRDANSETATLRFIDGERITIKIVQRSDEEDDEDEPAEDRPDNREDAENPLAINRVNGMLLRARKALFNLDIETENPTVTRQSFAVLLTEDGFAITQFHPLRSSPGGTALVPGLEEPVRFELWSVYPTLDLALIKLPSDAYQLSGQMHALPIAKEGPETGQAVWAVGVGDTGQSFITAGEVSAVTPYSQLDAKVRRSLPFEPLSYWVKTTATINAYTSGGPMVSSAGELVGMSVWTWGSGATPPTRDPRTRRTTPAAASTPNHYGLVSDHVQMILGNKPAAPLTFEKALPMYALTHVPHTRMPQIEAAMTGTPATLRLAANHFHNSSTCPLCDGAGEIKVNRDKQPDTIPIDSYGNNNSNDRNNRNNRDNEEDEDESEDDMVECPRCEGLGYTHPEALLRLGSNIVTALSTIDPSHPQAQRAFVHAETHIKEALETNPQRLAIPLNNEARKYLNRAMPSIGQPMVFMGAMDSSDDLDDQPGRPLIVSLGDSEPRMIVTNPVRRDYNLNNVVLVGGLLAGYLADDQGNLVPVISGGFAFNVPEEGDADDPFGQEEQRQSARDRFRQFMMDRYRGSQRTYGPRGR